MNGEPLAFDTKARGWLVYVGGQPIAPAHPLMMSEAAEVWQFYARRRDTTGVEIVEVTIEAG